MRTKVIRLLKLLLKCYFLVSGILMLFIGCGVIWLFWRMHGYPFGYAVPHSTLKAILLPIPKRALSAEDLAFGEHQVEEMVQDRPEMGRYVHKGDPIWQLCARQYGGEAIGERIDWNNFPPDGVNAEHQLPSPGQPGKIRVRAYDPDRQRANTCEELWSYAFFELCNIRNHTRQDEAWDAALVGKISRQEYIKRAAQLEYQALPYTASIYTTLWKPCMEAKHIGTTPSLWGLTAPGTADEWFAQYTYMYMGLDQYPSAPYGKWYDDAVMPILQQHAKDTGIAPK